MYKLTLRSKKSLSVTNAIAKRYQSSLEISYEYYKNSTWFYVKTCGQTFLVATSPKHLNELQIFERIGAISFFLQNVLN